MCNLKPNSICSKIILLQNVMNCITKEAYNSINPNYIIPKYLVNNFSFNLGNFNKSYFLTLDCMLMIYKIYKIRIYSGLLYFLINNRTLYLNLRYDVKYKLPLFKIT